MSDPDKRAVAQEFFTQYKQVKSRVENFTKGLEELDLFSCKISPGDWYKLRSDVNLDESEENLPRFACDASTSSLIMECAGALHESVCRVFHRAFDQSLPTSMEERLVCSMNLDFANFGGDYQDSEKIPDAVIELRGVNLDVSSPKCILEVGHSESYERLVQNAKLWIEGTETVSMVILVKITEGEPNYSCPFNDHTSPQDVAESSS